MKKMPASIGEFLGGRRIAVAGVSRNPQHVGNVILKKLKGAGYETFAVNPHAAEVEGTTCYPDVRSVPSPVDGVVIATRPEAALAIVHDCVASGVRHVWFHRSFGAGSVADDAVRECQRHGITAIVGGCPMMYCGPVDFGHACMRWWLGMRGRVPV